jgi:hypothetical protein
MQYLKALSISIIAALSFACGSSGGITSASSTGGYMGTWTGAYTLTVEASSVCSTLPAKKFSFAVIATQSGGNVMLTTPDASEGLATLTLYPMEGTVQGSVTFMTDILTSDGYYVFVAADGDRARAVKAADGRPELLAQPMNGVISAGTDWIAQKECLAANHKYSLRIR